METDKKERQVFKIWDRTNKKYVTGDKSKTTWRSMKWVISKIDDLCRETKGLGYSYRNTRRDPSEFEIRIFELQIVEQIDARSLYIQEKERQKNLNDSNDLIKNLEYKIKNLVPGVSLDSILAMYKDEFFSIEVMEKLRPMIENRQKEKTLVKTLSKPIK